ncbi:flavodoxin domain-containing protein [Halioxenophilus sp. WMMB6]|uniref:flavodoxin domain-containing protein n=1 Tax=Halioxenophilus sp. WMMB6 TaxID=3073815 RepID=UPI00295E52E0|nr:flavodoxin domain-containing protein [Halioxenophilus sp. WMMB6]
MAKILILVGSVNGCALQSAEAVGALMERLGHQVELISELGPRDLLRDPQELLLVCCSTTGDGQLPRNLYGIYYAMDDGVVDLHGRYYGVIALGDRGYPQFAAGGLKLEGMLYKAGAKRIGDICLLDAQVEDNQPLAAAKWALEWHKLLSEQGVAA